MSRGTSNRRGIKTYQRDQKMSWMDSSIDLSQPEIYNLKVPKPSSSRNSSEAPDSRRSDLGSHRSQSNFGNKYLLNDNLRRSLHNHRSSQVLQKNAQSDLHRDKQADYHRSVSIENRKQMHNSFNHSGIKDRSLRSRYHDKIHYIHSPLREKRTPAFSTSQIYY